MQKLRFWKFYFLGDAAAFVFLGLTGILIIESSTVTKPPTPVDPGVQFVVATVWGLLTLAIAVRFIVLAGAIHKSDKTAQSETIPVNGLRN